MKKRLLAMLLCIAMLAVLFAGCGSETASVEETASSAEVVSEAPEAPAEEPAADAPAEEAPAEEPVASIQYPVSDGETYSIAVVMDGTLLDYVPGGDPANASGIALMQEKTGIKFDYTVFAMMSDNMTLMIASGEWTDIICKINESYSTGIQGALDDDIVIDLDPYIDEYAPDFAAHLRSDDQFLKDTYTDDGKLGGFYNFNTPGVSGWGVRMDWLKEAGIDEVPVTYDDMEKAAIAVLEKHPEIPSALPMASSFIQSGFEHEIMYGFGIDTINSEFFINEEGVMDYAWTTQNARDYLELVARWVDLGIVNKDEMISGDVATMGNRIYQDQALFKRQDTSLWSDDVLAMAEAPDFEIAPMLEPVRNEGDVLRFGAAETRTSLAWSISTTCENVETLIQAINWIYTEEGKIATNFGKEGESYTIDENGVYHFTDLVLNNPNGVPLFMAVALYTGFEIPCIVMQEQVDAKLTNDYQFAGQDFWRTQEKTSEGMRRGSLTTEELEQVASYADIDTLVQEKAMAFATGELELNDENWNEFVSQVESMGIKDIIAVYQGAHDRYMAK